MNKHSKAKPGYQVTVYDGHDITTNIMTREQAKAINPQSYDYFLSFDLDIWAFMTADNRWIEHTGMNMPGMGPVCKRIIEALMYNAGEALVCQEIAEITGYSTLRNNYAVSARLLSIRKLHQESYAHQHFFLSRKTGGYAIAWNQLRTFCIVERVTPVASTTK